MSEIGRNPNLKKLKELCEKTTKVVGWYPHPYDGQGQVRGPFHRWFLLQPGDDTPNKYLADHEDDINYCAAAMNSLPHLLERIEQLEELKAKADDAQLKVAIEALKKWKEVCKPTSGLVNKAIVRQIAEDALKQLGVEDV